MPAGVVLVHGFTQTRDCWGPLPDRLEGEVIRVDAPGHGAAGDVRADLAETADLLAEHGPATYVGYSMGGRMCLELALRHSDVVERLVLVSATAGIEDDEERAIRRDDDDALADRIEAIGVDAFIDEWLALPLFDGLLAEHRYEAERKTNTAEGLAGSLRLAGTGRQEPSWDRLAELSMPVLVVAGVEDGKFAALARRMVDTIGDNAHLEVLAGAGHTVHLEEPDLFVEVLERFLSR